MRYIPLIIALCGIAYIIRIVRRHRRARHKQTASKPIRYPLCGRDGKYVRGGRGRNGRHMDKVAG